MWTLQSHDTLHNIAFCLLYGILVTEDNTAQLHFPTTRIRFFIGWSFFAIGFSTKNGDSIKHSLKNGNTTVWSADITNRPGRVHFRDRETLSATFYWAFVNGSEKNWFELKYNSVNFSRIRLLYYKTQNNCNKWEIVKDLCNVHYSQLFTYIHISGQGLIIKGP